MPSLPLMALSPPHNGMSVASLEEEEEEEEGGGSEK